MMRTPFLLLALLCLPLAPRAQADDVSDARQAIQAAYDRESDAWARKDVPALLAINALPKMVRVDLTVPSLTPVEERISQAHVGPKLLAILRNLLLKSLLANTTFLNSRFTIQGIALNGKTALVTANTHSVWIETNPKTRQDETRVTEGLYKETWEQAGNGWKRTASKCLSQSQTMNGKLLPLLGVK